jgi:putative transposase
LLARSQNELWTWNFTRFKGSVPWHDYYLYVIIDVFSRYVVGFMVAERESAELAIWINPPESTKEVTEKLL